jgi:hypothetical protein
MKDFTKVGCVSGWLTELLKGVASSGFEKLLGGTD